MNDLTKLAQVIEKQRAVIDIQARHIALLKTRLRLVDLREAKRLRDSDTLPTIFRQQAS